MPARAHPLPANPPCHVALYTHLLPALSVAACNYFAGYFEKEEAAGQAWDLAALKYFGVSADIISKLNFPASLDLFNQQQQRAEAEAAAAADAAAEPAKQEPQYRGVAKVR